MKKTITYEQLLKKEKQIKGLQEQGVIFIFKKNKIKLILGSFLIGFGLITFPIPTGSIPMIGFGCYLLGIGMSDLFRFKEELIRRLKNKWLKR